MKKQWMISAVPAVAALVTMAFVQAREGDPDPNQTGSGLVAEATSQPIRFPHSTHAGQFRIDCQYCHFSAERSVDAGIPPVASCMGCHTVLPGRNRPEEVNKLKDYYNRGEPIPWVRIYKVADHVHYPHARHVQAWEKIGAASKEVVCMECHGPVPEIEVIGEVNQPLSMGWCIDCHVRTEAKRDCAVCHY